MKKNKYGRLFQRLERVNCTNIQCYTTSIAGPFTMATACATVENGNTIIAYGISRKSDSDMLSQEIGEQIAISRALKALHMRVIGKTIRNVLMG